MASRKKLGRQMLETLQDLRKLKDATNDPNREDEIDAKWNKLYQQLGDLAEKNIDSATEEYKEATQSLRDASSEIRQAMKGMKSVAEAIRMAGKAAELVAKVA